VRRLKKRWRGREDLKGKVRKITRLLEKQYHVPRREVRGDPLDTLIQTILSQNTNDLNRDLAFRRLKTRFPHWEEVLNANTKALTQVIRPAGLVHQKARCIRETLCWIQKHHGKLSLSFLQEMDSEEIMKTIGGLKGIGPKTTHCLLLFGMGREAFPVDTHILRVGKHLGFIPVWMDANEAHQWVASLVPKGKCFSLHLNLIRFGRSVCNARKPHCSVCFLTKECLNPVQR